MLLDAYKIDVRENESAVLKLLRFYNIRHGGEILSPSKDVWFTVWYYIRICEMYGSPYYTYVAKSQKLEGKYLKDITLLELQREFFLRAQRERFRKTYWFLYHKKWLVP